MDRIEVYEGCNGNFVDARELHSFIGVDRSYDEWLNDTIRNPMHGFIETLDYEVYTDGVTANYYISTIMAGDLAMMAHGEQRARDKYREKSI